MTPEPKQNPWQSAPLPRETPKRRLRLFPPSVIRPFLRPWERNRQALAARAERRRLMLVAGVLAVMATVIVGALVYVERAFVSRMLGVALEIAGVSTALSGDPSVERPQTGVLYNATGREPTAPLMIIAPSGVDHFIKLVDFETGAEGVALYIRDGETLDVLVPVGSFRLRHAFGTGWQGEEALFGRGLSTRFEEATVPLNFRNVDGQVQGWTVDLNPKPGGDFYSRPSLRSGF